MEFLSVSIEALKIDACAITIQTRAVFETDDESTVGRYPDVAPPTVEVESSQNVEVNNEVVVPLTAEEINARLSAQLDKLREKDRTSRQLSKEVCKKKEYMQMKIYPVRHRVLKNLFGHFGDKKVYGMKFNFFSGGGMPKIKIMLPGSIVVIASVERKKDRVKIY